MNFSRIYLYIVFFGFASTRIYAESNDHFSNIENNISESKELKVIEIEDRKAREVALSEITESVIAIPLETNSELLIPFVRKVKFSDKYIFVSDNQYLYRFDFDGRFINRINKAGRGPGEITTFTDFFIEKDDDIVTIATRGKLQRYHYDGSLIEEITIQGIPEQAQKINSSIWINKNDFSIPGDDRKYHNISRLIRLNNDFIPVDSLIILETKLKSPYRYVRPADVFYSFAGEYSYYHYPELLVEPATHDTLFQITEKKLIPAYKLRFEDRLYKLNKNQKDKSEIPPNKIFRISAIYISSHFIFSSYSIKDENYFLCHDINTGENYYARDGFIDDIFNTGKVQPEQFNYATDRMFFTKDGYEVAGKIEGIDENSNPVIFIVKLKE